MDVLSGRACGQLSSCPGEGRCRVIHGWLMREAGGFVAAGLPVSAGGSMPRTALGCWARRGPNRHPLGLVRRGPIKETDASLRGAAGSGRSASCAGGRGTGETAHTSRGGRRFVRLTLLCGANRTHPEPRRGGCAFSPAGMGVRGSSEAPKRKNRCSPDELRRGTLKTVRRPNSCRRGLRTEDPRIYRALMAWRPPLGT